MAQFGSDSFTGSASTLLETYNSTWVRHTNGSTSGISAFLTDANRVRGTSAGGGAACYRYNVDPGTGDYSAKLGIYEASDAMYGAGPCVRMHTTNATFYLARWYSVTSPDVVQIFRFVSGVVTQLGSDYVADLTTGASRDIRLESITSGSDVILNVYLGGNSTPDITYTDLAADGPITANGYAGFRLGYGGSSTPSNTVGLHGDNFSADTVGGSGSTGTLAYTNANDTLAASGTVGSVTGALAYTNADDTLAASGTTAIVGALATTNVDDSLTASGSTTVTGSSGNTNSDDTLAASGAVGNSVNGSLAYTNADDTLSASGTTTITGSSNTGNQNDTLAAAGNTEIVGSLSTINANDVLSASGIVGSVTGTLAYTNANDSIVASGSAGNEASKAGGDDYPLRVVQKARKKTLAEQPNKHLESIIAKAVKEVFGEGKEVEPITLKPKPSKVLEQKIVDLPITLPIDMVIPISEQNQAVAEEVGELLALYQQQVQLAQMQEDEDLLVLIMEMY